MKTITFRRVVVTGLGAVTDLGTDAPSTWEGMLSGRSGVVPITAFEQDDEWTTRFAGEVSDFDPSKIIDVREAKRMDRASLLGLVAAEEAANDCGIDFSTGDPDRRGVAIGSGIGGIITIEVGLLKLERTSPKKISPFTVPKLMVNACAGNVSIRHDLRGANIATATACATGGHSIGAAFQLIQRGDADVMFAGGTEAAVSRLCIGSFGTMKALSTRNDDPQRASRPFDRDRDGFVLAEGAAVLILEDLETAKARGAKIYGEILGYATSGDAHHIAAPEESGIGATKAMTWALKDAEINTTDVGYINAHGTSTPLGDAAEVYAVKSVFGEHAADLAMSSTKSMTGHALGAAGGIESVAVIRALQDGVLPPTINLENPDDGFDLDFVANEAREKPIQYAVNNSFGFGGHNVSLVFSRYNGD
ncbi:MAG: beta-ketoacyl-[acyl-carrier-protein] synthase II [Phycisphaerae bacterium]|nr:beta-ketoacyl-[acyl-carrier-protein] synthase II [Phycisphaerae bacterium]OUX00258.1 MAG: beta-ketoacyl-[acyl-carrier-protein] synthase II [Phycisphaeraceae bacterium TMED231]